MSQLPRWIGLPHFRRGKSRKTKCRLNSKYAKYVGIISAKSSQIDHIKNMQSDTSFTKLAWNHSEKPRCPIGSWGHPGDIKTVCSSSDHNNKFINTWSSGMKKLMLRIRTEVTAWDESGHLYLAPERGVFEYPRSVFPNSQKTTTWTGSVLSTPYPWLLSKNFKIWPFFRMSVSLVSLVMKVCLVSQIWLSRVNLPVQLKWPNLQKYFKWQQWK